MNYGTLAVVGAALALCACGKEPAPGEHVDAATQVGVSTSGALGSALNAPANYMRGMQGKVDKAEEAAAAYQKAAETHDGNKADTGE